MRLLILGARGFIGGSLVTLAVSRGIGVEALARGGLAPAAGVEGHAWALGEPVPESACRGIDCAIHLAYDFNGQEGASRTLDSTLAMARQLNAADVPRQLYFSSYSAGPQATSLYGRTKLSIERGLADVGGVVIVRPGLVLGDGGIFGRIRKWARLLPVIPLPDGGRGKVPVIGIARLCEETLALAGTSFPGLEANLFEREFRTLRELVMEAAAEVGRRPIIVPIPAALVRLALKTAEYLRIRLPVNSDNLAGFLGNQAASHESTLQ